MTTNETPEIRAYYLDCMRTLYRKKTNNSVLLDRQEYNAKLERLLELENPLEKRIPSDSRLAKMCVVRTQESDGSITVKLCKRGTNMPYVPLEDLFDIIHKAHVSLNHAGRNGLQRHFRDRYANITKDCIMTYLNTCIDCPRTKRAGHLIGLRRRAYSPNFPGLNTGADIFSSDFFGTNIENDHDDEDDDENETLEDSELSSTVNKGFNDESINPVGSGGGSGVSANASIISTTPLNIPLLKLLNSGIKKGENGSGIGCKRELDKRSSPVGQMNGSDDRFTRGQVDVFNMETEPDGDLKFIMRYTNLSTHEVRLCALKSAQIEEITDTLVDIYCEQGAPITLQSLNGRQFVEEVIDGVVKIWPICRQLHSEMREKGVSLESDESILIDKLWKVMKRYELTSWARSLRFLQWELNTTLDLELGRAPIELSLGRIPTIGLKSSKLLDAIYDKARSEEEIMEFLQDAELLRLSAFCQQSSSNFTQSLGPIPEKRSRIALQQVDDALILDGKMSNFGNNGYFSGPINVTTSSSSSSVTTNGSSDNGTKQAASWLNGNGVTQTNNNKFRHISTQQQRNNINNFVQRISERFHQQQQQQQQQKQQKQRHDQEHNNNGNSSDHEEKNYLKRDNSCGYNEDKEMVSGVESRNSTLGGELERLNSQNNHDCADMDDGCGSSVDNSSDNRSPSAEIISPSNIKSELCLSAETA